MLIDLDELIKLYNIQLTGILHIGAHLCEELVKYEKYISRDKVLWIEANPEKVARSRELYPNVRIETAVISDIAENVVFHVSNNGESSSILDLGTHQMYYPGIKYVQHYRAMAVPISNILVNYPDIPFNFLNMDIQGVELKALKGFGEHLDKIDYIYTEVNQEQVYVNCALLGEIDEYLDNRGFTRVKCLMTDAKWGDAFYVRRSVSGGVDKTEK